MADECACVYFESVSDAEDVSQGHVPLSPLDRGDVREMQSGALGQLLLTQLAFETTCAYACTELDGERLRLLRAAHGWTSFG